MQILLGISEKDIDTILKLVCVAEQQCRIYGEKEDEEGLLDNEIMEFDNWLAREDLFRRMEALINNEMILRPSEAFARNAAEASGNCPVALKEHCMRKNWQMEHDGRALEIMRKGLDVPSSHIQAKSHQDTSGNHPCQ